MLPSKSSSFGRVQPSPGSLGLLGRCVIVSPDFPSHWKTQLLIRLTGTHESVLCLLKFWAHCQNRKTHRFTGINPSVLASICNWAGEPEKLWNAMLESKFIEVDGEQLIAHQWDEYNGTLISNWRNGSKGGRPRNPRESHGVTHGITHAVGNASNLSSLSTPSTQSGPNGKASASSVAFALKTKREAVERRIKEVERRGWEDSFGINFNEKKDREEWATLTRQLSEIDKQLVAL